MLNASKKTAWCIEHLAHSCCLVAALCLTLLGPHGLQEGKASLSSRFPRQDYWSGLPFPSLGDLPNTGIPPVSPALAGKFFTTEPPGKPVQSLATKKIHLCEIANHRFNDLDE